MGELASLPLTCEVTSFPLFPDGGGGRRNAPQLAEQIAAEYDSKSLLPLFLDCSQYLAPLTLNLLIVLKASV